MKRSSAVVTFILFLALCASVAGWTMQLFKPAQRATAAAPVSETPVSVQLNAASELFGIRKTSVPAATKYAVKGIVVARQPRDSVAILAVDGKPAQALQIGAEVVPGVTLKEVHPQFVLLTQGAREMRIDVPETASAMIGQDERAQRVNADAHTQAPERTSSSSDAVRPGERPQRPSRRVPGKTPVARAQPE